MRTGKETNGQPKFIFYVTIEWMQGLPKGCETYGNGVAIVVSDWESQLQGEVRQVDHSRRTS